jgi:uncharacterized membrane protein
VPSSRRSLARRNSSGGLSRLALRVAPLGAFTGLGAIAAFDAAYFLAGLCGLGAAFAGKRLMDREGNARRELRRRARENAQELKSVAREDRIAAPQMTRLAELQNGLLESWELLPEDYHPMLEEDVYTIIEEVENAARLARRRSALRRHLDRLDRKEIARRIESLERDIEGLEEGSTMRATFESALESRKSELEGYGDMLNGISLVNAQLEGAESLLSSLRGDLLTLDSSMTPYALDSGLARLKERVALFKKSFDDVSHAVETIPDPATEQVTLR